jgi:FAD:protein FMN transferase
MKKFLLYFVVFLVLFFIGYRIASDSGGSDVVSRTRVLMGTIVEIQIKETDEEVADAAINEAFNEINRIDILFSPYQESGSVYNINYSNDPLFKIEGDLLRVFEYSDSLWKLTGGAFDPTLHVLTELWRFDTEPVFPGEDSIKSVIKKTGWDKIGFNEGSFSRNGVMFNFGAIAKGYAVDKAIDVLKKNNIKSALVDAGGEIKSIGNFWKVGIQDPRESNSLINVIELNDMSVATSGDYEQYFEYQGKRYHHILDPATGFPGIKSRSVTVITKQNVIADALATGIFIMGPIDGLSIIEKIKDTEAMIIDSQGEVWMSSGFNNYILR